MGCNPRLFHPHLCWRTRLHGPLDSPFIPQPLLDSSRSSSLTIRATGTGSFTMHTESRCEAISFVRITGKVPVWLRGCAGLDFAAVVRRGDHLGLRRATLGLTVSS